jgi:hypothetical protein
MAAAREFLGYLMGAIFASVAILMMVMAWVGVDKVFGWQLAAVLLVFSLIIRVNLFVLMGSYLFASHVWGFDPLQSVVFVLPGLMFLSPGIITTLFGAVSRPHSYY